MKLRCPYIKGDLRSKQSLVEAGIESVIAAMFVGETYGWRAGSGLSETGQFGPDELVEGFGVLRNVE